MFRRIFFAANAVRFVSTQFIIYSDTMHNAQGCVCSLLTGSQRQNRLGYFFSAHVAFLRGCGSKMHNNITKRIISFREVSNNLLSTPMGIDYVVIGFNMEVQPLVIHFLLYTYFIIILSILVMTCFIGPRNPQDRIEHLRLLKACLLAVVLRSYSLRHSTYVAFRTLNTLI